MTPEKLKQLFPHASQSTLRVNAADTEDRPQRLRSADTERNEGRPLVGTAAGEEARWHLPAGRFEITFTVYSTHPADYDNYSVKYSQDWLVKAGILPGDGWKTLSGRTVSRKADAKEEERTEIEIVQCFGPE